MFIASLSLPSVNFLAKVYCKNSDSLGRGLVHKKLNVFSQILFVRKFRNCENLHASPKLTPLEVSILSFPFSYK